MKELSISIIIPTYNRAGLICRAIDSALAASRPDDEVIVVDDGSTDDTDKVIHPYQKRIRYLRRPNCGAGAARNFGVQAALNPLIAFLDSDDEWMPDKLRMQRALMMARPEILFCFTDFAIRHDSGKLERRYLIQWHQDERPWDEILGPGVPFSTISPLPEGLMDFRVHVGNLFAGLMSAAYVFTSTILINREAAGEALRFPEDIRIFEDWECFGRLARAGLAAYLDCETVWQYGHGGIRLTGASDLIRAEARIALLERVWGADRDFLVRHGDRYRGVLEAQRLIRVKELIKLGMVREARSELRLVEKAPLSFRALAAIPASLAKAVLDIRRAFRGSWRMVGKRDCIKKVTSGDSSLFL